MKFKLQKLNGIAAMKNCKLKLHSKNTKKKKKNKRKYGFLWRVEK